MAKEIYTRFVSGVLFPLHERLKGHSTVAVRKQLETSQWWDRDRLASLQALRLREFLCGVQEQVPYYRALFQKAGFDARAVLGITDLRRLPFLTKGDIRANVESLKSERATGLARSNTGGSSGEPLVFYIGKQRVSHDVAAKWRATRWWDVDIGDPEIVVWGSPIELGAQDHARQLRDRLFRTRLLPAFEMSESKLDAFVDTIQSVRPRMLFGYPSALAHIARHARARGTRLDALGIRVALVTSERLYADQRATIEQVYGCRAANGYGGRDAGFIAHECPAGGMHVTAEDIVVEIVDPQGAPVPAGEAGEIVITHMATGDYPFVRYRTGDVGALDDAQCSCGRGLPLLKELQGRTTDFVVAKDGTIMHGLALIYVVRDLPGIESFKIVQESLELTRVLIVPAAQFSQQQANAIVDGLKRRLGRDVEVVVERVRAIPAERSGKLRYVVSHVALPQASPTMPPIVEDVSAE